MNTTEGPMVVGQFQISNRCLQTFPCQHSILIDGKWERLNATEIYTLLESNGLSHPHFNYCKEVIRKRTNPTCFEMMQNHIEQIKSEQRRKQQEQQYIDEQNKLKAIREQCSASVRLAKLKQANNIKPPNIIL